MLQGPGGIMQAAREAYLPVWQPDCVCTHTRLLKTAPEVQGCRLVAIDTDMTYEASGSELAGTAQDKEDQGSTWPLSGADGVGANRKGLTAFV